jgi:hypothetical protein
MHLILTVFFINFILIALEENVVEDKKIIRKINIVANFLNMEILFKI